ncbi:MAG TPA: pyridoxamine 5'-phosphate oxidase family protein, partial [Victivallales bacterium]|nr:pyridoxamine 5'-phosphate oxidase family protein [Victivallales bacterium]
MNDIPQEIIMAWEKRKGPLVFTTADANGVPNSIYATCVVLCGCDTVIVADNYFDKTRKNILNGGKKGSILFITEEGNAYQLKGEIEYHTEGPIYDLMKKHNPPKHPGHAAAALKIE